MKISKVSIKALKPCSDRFDNYLKFYSSKAHSPAQFLGLKNITHADKVWVSSRLIKPELRRLAAADIAELVLPIFEAKYPNDLRPRQAIAAARDLSLSAEELRDKAAATYTATYVAYATNAANAAANAAYAAAYAAANAAYAAAYAAANAAYAAANATTYAAYTAAVNAAYAAANAAYAAANAAADAAADAANASNQDPKILKKIRTILLKYLNRS